jgi:sterol desaturase/sphingolipid hydroxylase (fatty acid hydroxylase superfamily)
VSKRVPVELERTADARTRVRERMLAAVPGWYSPYGHLSVTVGISFLVLFVAWRHLGPMRPVDWVIVPLTGMLGNLLEYRLHKYALHRRRWPFKLLYDRHTPEHHAIYMTEDMAIRSSREFRLVLIPAFGVAGLALATAPFAALFGAVLGANAGWLFLVTAACVMVSYEVLHLTYHLPADSFIGRLRLIRVLRRHHATHHDPRLMQRWNFNVTVPFFDWVFGTIYASPETETETETESEGTRPARSSPRPTAAAVRDREQGAARRNDDRDVLVLRGYRR